ncbi:hypothetical protein CVT24_001219 [Panaeolus cyanescens]|uniref:Uncharacterized protein n=1 Tax=Panaeolus cyanescens TaxID=181874 RepID=A0A409VTW9_9AGAR|nr:hypothetical protein CVT24_001219 [Panaeolus cyanescens]
MLQLANFPEEILEQILAPCVIAPLALTSRPTWHKSSTKGSGLATRSRLAPLLVSKSFHRISTPLFLETLHIISPTQLHRLLSTLLSSTPCLAHHIRHLIFAGVWAEGGELLRLCGHALKYLHITLDITPGFGTHPALPLHATFRDLDAEEFCDGLQYLSGLLHLVITKPNNVYLTHFKPKYVLAEISRSLVGWTNLESANIGFRLSDDTAITHTDSSTATASHDPAFDPHLFPIRALSHSLSIHPRLKSLYTVLPSVWSETILRISNNPSLQRIVLSDTCHVFSSHPNPYPNPNPNSNVSSLYRLHNYTANAPLLHQHDQRWSTKDLYASPVGACIQPINNTAGPSLYEPATGILWTGLFFSQARKHPRLSELIRAGT